MDANAWRALVATLSDDRCRRVYARLVLGDDATEEFRAMSPGAARRVERSLVTAGLAKRDGDRLRPAPEVFARALAAAPAPERPSGVDRFFSAGRLRVYPARQADRAAVLARIAHRVITVDESVDEATINERLSAIVDDVASMRRYLVDAGLLTRSRTGDAYRRGDAPRP